MDKKLILLIDDDVDLLSSLKITLEHNGYDVITAMNGTEGLSKLRESHPNLLILDIMMDSALEGYNVLNNIKGDVSIKNIPVIMLTGMADAIGVNFRSAVEDDKMFPNVIFMEKPFENADLLTEINKALQ